MQPNTLTLSSVGQITLPRSVRELLGLEKGAKLNYEVDKKTKSIILKKQPTFDEVMAKLDEIDQTYLTPKPDPRAKNMTRSEIVEEELEKHPLEGDTWI